jgi:hypothetical protein
MIKILLILNLQKHFQIIGTTVFFNNYFTN